MTLFVTADLASGVILQQSSDSRPWEETLATWPITAEHGLVIIPAPLPARLDHYRVVDGEVVERPDMPVTLSATTIAADGEDECVLSGLPDPCTVIGHGAVSAGPVEVTGGSLTLTSTAAGTITVSIMADPVWKPWEATLHAT